MNIIDPATEGVWIFDDRGGEWLDLCVIMERGTAVLAGENVFKKIKPLLDCRLSRLFNRCSCYKMEECPTTGSPKSRIHCVPY